MLDELIELFNSSMNKLESGKKIKTFDWYDDSSFRGGQYSILEGIAEILDKHKDNNI